MKKELHFLGEISEGGSVKPTHFKVTKTIAKHEKNKHLELIPGIFIAFSNCVEKQPEDTAEGYYVCSGGQWIFVKYS